MPDERDESLRPEQVTRGEGARAAIRVLLADDEPLIREMLGAALRAEPDVDVVGECANGTEALAAATALRPDVLFLDIRMPGLSGLEVAAALTTTPPPLVVFVTAYDAHAVRAFELNAVDYLLKPFDPARVRATMERVRARLAPSMVTAEPGLSPAPDLATLVERVTTAIESIAPGSPLRGADRFVVTMSGRMRVIEADAVEWIEADGNYARLHLAKGSALLRETMKSLEARLAPHQFVRVHRSALVRLAAIRELEPTPAGDYRVHLAGGASVTMSRSYRDDVVRRLGQG